MRARERYAADRKRGGSVPRRRRRHAAMPNLIIIGGLKCGTTSIHHYLGLHPEIHMSKPKELNFFVEELNWDLGLDWYRGRFDDRFAVRGESSPHYTNLPYFHGVAERIHAAPPRREADLHGPRPDQPHPLPLAPRHRRRLRDAADGGGAGPRRPDLRHPLAVLDAAAALPGALRSPQIAVITQEELQGDRDGTMRRAFEFAGVDPNFTSEQFDREWEKSTAKESDQYQLMEKLIKLPGFRSFDRNFDRLPERMRWMVEKVVHDPEAPPAPKPELPDAVRESLRRSFSEDSPRSRSSPAASSQAGSSTNPVAEDRRRSRRADRRRRGRPGGAAQSAATSRSPTARWPRASATTGPGPARPPPATSPRAAPTRRSSAAGPAPAPRSRPTRSRRPSRALPRRPDRRGRAQLERRQRPRAQPARHLRGRARRDPRRLVRRRAQRRCR